MENADKILTEPCYKGDTHDLFYDFVDHVITCTKCNKTWLSKEYYPKNQIPDDNSSDKSSYEG